jgi:hypothetical protein
MNNIRYVLKNQTTGEYYQKKWMIYTNDIVNAKLYPNIISAQYKCNILNSYSKNEIKTIPVEITVKEKEEV